MKLLEHTKNSTGYKVRIWLDETKHDLQGNPYEEWVLERTWGLQVPQNEVENGKVEKGEPKFKLVDAMTQKEYETSQLKEAIGQARELLAQLSSDGQQVTKPKTL